MSAWERCSLPMVGAFSQGAPRAAENADAPPTQPWPLLPLCHPVGPGPAPPLPFPHQSRAAEARRSFGSRPKMFSQRSWAAAGSPGMRVWLVFGRLFFFGGGGHWGKLGLREELWSFSCWAGFHLGKAEPSVPRSALVLLTGERGELGRGGRRRRDEPTLRACGMHHGHRRFWHSKHQAVPG